MLPLVAQVHSPEVVTTAQAAVIPVVPVAQAAVIPVVPAAQAVVIPVVPAAQAVVIPAEQAVEAEVVSLAVRHPEAVAVEDLLADNTKIRWPKWSPYLFYAHPRA